MFVAKNYIAVGSVFVGRLMKVFETERVIAFDIGDA